MKAHDYCTRNPFLTANEKAPGSGGFSRLKGYSCSGSTCPPPSSKSASVPHIALVMNIFTGNAIDQSVDLAYEVLNRAFRKVAEKLKERADKRPTRVT